MKETILSTEKLNISYTKGQERPTVREMDFEISRGEIIGLV
jgi:ABC-type microcin C transport system duplicated ATPase subunit YejF